jgi:peptidoglycan hydrolase CwlO-like protein
MYIYQQFKRYKFCSRKTRNVLFSGLFVLLLVISIPSLLAQEDIDGKRAEELRAELNSHIEELTRQIEKHREAVEEIQSQAKSLEGELNLLNSQIKKFGLEIERIKLIIGGIESEIKRVELKIRELGQQTETEKIILGELIREIHKRDETSFLEIVLTKENLSDFFSEIQSLENLQLGIQKSLEKIRILKEELKVRKAELEEQKNEMIALKAIQEIQKHSIEKKQKEHQKLLDETKGQEYLYQRLIKNKQMDVNTVRSQLYILQGMGGSLSFENALSIAEFASSVTGVRPAFLLAVLSKESGWGANVGTGTWRVDMKPNQHSAYLAICEKLGFNSDMMPVSRKAWYGWGGAMGPAQFLPRTWLGYESRIAAITGHSPPSPWDMDDAFVASALYLANAGATSQTYKAEHKAYMIYLAGSNWRKHYLQFYGDRVMDLAAVIQEQINLIK